MQLTKIDRANQRLSKMHNSFKAGLFPHYEELYKNLVGFALPLYRSPRLRNDEPIDPTQKSLDELLDYFEGLKSKDFFVNADTHWTYIEYKCNQNIHKRPAYQSLIKLYAPVSNIDLPIIGRTIFDFLVQLDYQFFYKVAHKGRTDNICLWIQPIVFEAVITFLKGLQKHLLPAPTFCPEYHGIGITKELSSSFNEIIAYSLYKYFSYTNQPNVQEYFEFFDNEIARSKTRSYNAFDVAVVSNSLQCIINNECPVNSTKFNITQLDQAIKDQFIWR